MSRPFPVQEPYVTKDGSRIRELVNPLLAPGLGMSLAEAEVAAGSRTEAHFHTDFDEMYYCLQGAGLLYVNNRSFPFSPGTYHLISKGSIHFLTATMTIRLLCICCPGYTHEETVLVGNYPPAG